MMTLLMVVLLVAVLLFVFYMVSLAHQDIIKEERIVLAGESMKPDVMRLFFIADVHRRKIKADTLAKIEAIDGILLAGDMIERFVPFRRLEANLQLLKRWGDIPIFFVAGNNDYEKSRRKVEALLEKYGVTILDDDYVIAEIKQRPILLAGMPYLADETERAFPFTDLPSNHAAILLCHSPYTYYSLRTEDKRRFSHVFAGHTHGGQIRIFGYGPYRRGGWRYDGMVSMLITEGYGYSLLPFRLGTEAQCHVITVTIEGKGRKSKPMSGND